jgi:hypothetical protein
MQTVIELQIQSMDIVSDLLMTAVIGLIISTILDVEWSLTTLRIETLRKNPSVHKYL